MIDPFGASDSAEYACSASDGETVNVSTPLTLTGSMYPYTALVFMLEICIVL